ncbi:hypothetical protein [Sphingomonas sp. TDK1]|uniref:hypothetical protein n=1 Tax=Sphingomonas sp. TDK1 TaxID=453247 RepID=UPI0007D95B9A|nr:hypothetical protein [Sphingomonas sp. TDK1]OAN66202.1 hypothetical protein A7X12_12450 [Sphingomonas sp. TDK1]
MTTNPMRDRTETERHAHQVDAQGAPPRDGRVDALAGKDPDGIPMTGEEDPYVEAEHLPIETGDDAEAEAHPS